jgi:hypothetical protein
MWKEEGLKELSLTVYGSERLAQDHQEHRCVPLLIEHVDVAVCLDLLHPCESSVIDATRHVKWTTAISRC